jgi:hypothetical protein
LAPAIFVCQEHFERLLHDGVFPWGAVADRTFVVGLALQLPFAAVAYVLARLLLRAVRSLGGLLANARCGCVVGESPRWACLSLVVPRVSVVALGYGSRGPPSASR